MGKSCLITGGAGFIGSNLVRRLASLGMRLRVLDNLSAGRAADLEGTGAEVLIGDIRDQQLVEQAVQGMETVIHLAAHTNVIESIKTPEVNLEINVKGTFNLLQASVKYGVKRFVFASTGGAIIGETDPPVHEDLAPHPISPYGAGKLAGEGYCSAFWGSYGLKSICLRFSNVYGPFSYHKGSVIAKFFRRVQVGEPVTVYGDGGQTRDFVYVGDLEKAIATALQVEELPFGEAIQLGTGKETSINELVGLMRKVVGEEVFPSVDYQPSRPGEVLRNYVSIARANQYLSFVPTTTLEEGLKETWRWFKQEI